MIGRWPNLLRAARILFIWLFDDGKILIGSDAVSGLIGMKPIVYAAYTVVNRNLCGHKKTRSEAG